MSALVRVARLRAVSPARLARLRSAFRARLDGRADTRARLSACHAAAALACAGAR